MIQSWIGVGGFAELIMPQWKMWEFDSENQIFEYDTGSLSTPENWLPSFQPEILIFDASLQKSSVSLLYWFYFVIMVASPLQLEWVKTDLISCKEQDISPSSLSNIITPVQWTRPTTKPKLAVPGRPRELPRGGHCQQYPMFLGFPSLAGSPLYL